MIGKKTLMAGAALLVAATAIPAAYAAYGHQHGHHGQGGGFGFLQGVTLTAAQQDQVKQITQATWTSVKPLAQQLRGYKKQISDQLASTATIDPAALSALQAQAAQVAQQIQSQHLTAALQVRALLTPAQLAQSAQVHAQLVTLHSQEKAVLGAQ